MTSFTDTKSNISSFFHTDLPWPISYIPKICKIIALIYIAPPIFLFIFDVGSYLLFKLFLKPFGDYPRYAYFKQAPRDSFDRSAKDPPSASTSASGSPAIASGVLPFTPTGLRKRPFKARDPSKEDIRVEGVGFEGPMLDFKSPTASDYEDDVTSNEDNDLGDSSETTSN
ncbi:hypothetical protein CROQUDRAFT_659550 [Cronartium quercuum f. sp. fusiforme G11]|uniref:Uncharacterized protein n=1 Tax=Cronartium quercuum f. sp. fusiforme G11 TaxID=708437 RepID=A0A9P6TA24_9BASI|nr:hypothetical protein CROQUDRAFT_659550 [Cronartium quercuum f. sp. fusiforme G11]